MQKELLNEAQQYGLAFLVMAMTIIGLTFAIVVLWKYLNKLQHNHSELMHEESKANREVIKENTIAFHSLQNLITSKL